MTTKRKLPRSRNAEIVAGLLNAPPIDLGLLVDQAASDICTAMAQIHGGEWLAVVDHQVPFVFIRLV